ncbi:MAG TPA: Dam family site-specific DNA-(adenine-N6)-methyltransferase [Vicinamibacterales bacterium]|nr:Dam family site-specific DNA-(adenine-N6)-methyltransferase [Vicinamibacterales bacterium]
MPTATAAVSTTEKAAKPPLKWAGGKRWQVPHLRPLWAPHAGRRLVEPFCGGLAVALGLAPDQALLNDLNPHLISFYRWLQRGLRLDDEIEMTNDKALYYAHRRRFNELVRTGMANGRESACLFYFLNRTGYNGLCRFNSRGEFNVPFGRYARIQYARDLSPYAEKLGRWTFVNDDLERLEIHGDDFIYADPPYDVEFTQYSSARFTWEDQERTALFVSRHRGPAVLVNQATTRIARLYRKLGFTLTYLQAPRRISCTGDRRPAREVLATRNL